MTSSVKKIFDDYIQALATQSWEAAEAFFHEEATVIFAEGTYRGKRQIAMAIGKTFSMIRDEHFEVRNLHWTIVKEAFATCTFEYEWSGTINNKRFTNPGRGTLAWVNDNSRWQIINEHFGPMPR